MNKNCCNVFVCLVAVFTLSTAWAIQLDTSYGDAGYVQTNVASYNGENQFARNVLVQADGKIIVAGNNDVVFDPITQEKQLGLIRYNTDGTRDVSFGAGGQVSSFISVGNVVANGITGMVQQADGKIVVASLGFGPFPVGNVVLLVRYNTDGTLDSTFGTNGQVITDSGDNDLPTSIIRQSDGKLVVSGSIDGNLSLIRYGADGALDTGFGIAGFATIDTGSYSSANAVAQQADGKLISANSDSVARFNIDGSLDTSFGVSGFGAMPAVTTGARGLAIQDNGQFVLVGQSTGEDIAITRFNPDGSLDLAFGTLGVVTTDVGGADLGRSIASDMVDGKIVVTGMGSNGANLQIVVLRYNADGSLDTTFSGDGIAETNIGDAADFGVGIVQQSDNKYVVVGLDYANTDSTINFVTLRYNIDGSLDSGFGDDGVVIDWISINAIDLGIALIAQDDGKMVAGGRSVYDRYRANLDARTDTALARYNTDGSLDSSFSTDGRTNNSIELPYSGTRDLIKQGNGQVVSLVGTYNGSTSDGALIRHNSDGSVDLSFGTDGVVLLSNAPYGGIQQSDGKLVVSVGDGMRRYDSLGVLDLTFGTNGLVTTAICGNNRCGRDSIVEQSSHNLVIVGELGMASYLDDGVLDTSFGTNGQVLFSSGVVSAKVAEQSNGGLLVAFQPIASLNTLTLMSFNANGLLNGSFGTAGTVTTLLNHDVGSNWILALAIQEDDKPVLFVRTDYSYFQLLRYDTNGLPDSSFDADGVYPLPFTVVNSRSTSVKMGDMVYQSGTFHVLVTHQDDFFIAKFFDFEVPPVAGTVVANDVTQTNAGETSYPLNIDYSDANGDLNISSITTANIAVCNGGTCANAISVTWPDDTFSGTATYTLSPPGGSWDEADNGTYTIAILANQIADDELNYVAADANAGSFTVSITDPTVPDRPIIGVAIPGDTVAWIEFSPPVSDGGMPILDYTASCGAGTPAVGTTSPLLIIGLPNDSTHTCYVTARNTVGSSQASFGVQVTPTGDDEVTLPPSGDDPGEVVTVAHTATPPGGGVPVPATLSIKATEASPPEPPAEAESLVSAIDIDSTSTVVGYALVVTFTIDASSINEFTGFWKYGKETSIDAPHWYDYGTLEANGDGTGYELSADKKTLTVYLIDGLRGDDDLLANASIVDPALPIVKVSPIVFNNSFE